MRIKAGMPQDLFNKRRAYSVTAQVNILKREVSEAMSDGVKKSRLSQYLINYSRKSAPEVQNAIAAHFSDFICPKNKNGLEI